MRRKRIYVLLFAGISALFCTVVDAQTSVAASLYGAFSQTTTGNSIRQNPSNSAGVLLELRHISNPLVGYEATYAYNRANQEYSSTVATALTCIGCTNLVSATASNSAHEITGDWIVSLRLGSLRPFGLAGGGLLLNEPDGGTLTTTQCSGSACPETTTSTPTSSSTKGVFVYGAGLDWTVLPHLGLRFQYRGNLYKASQLTTVFASSNAFTQTAEPMIGAFLQF